MRMYFELNEEGGIAQVQSSVEGMDLARVVSYVVSDHAAEKLLKGEILHYAAIDRIGNVVKYKQYVNGRNRTELQSMEEGRYLGVYEWGARTEAGKEAFLAFAVDKVQHGVGNV